MNDSAKMIEVSDRESGAEVSIGRILVVDDEPELNRVLVESLTQQGFDVTGCTSGVNALSQLREESFDLMITDLMMPQMDGITLLQAALEIDPNLVAIIMTGQGTIQTAVDAMRLGAFDYVLKPFRLQQLLPVLTRAVNMRRLRIENLQLRESVAIYGLTQTIAFTLDSNTVVSKLADAAMQQCDADEVSVLLPTPDGSELYVAAVRGPNRERLLGERIPLTEGIASWVARTREPVFLDGEVLDNRFTALWPRPDIKAAISVPMQVANKLIGVINLNDTKRHRIFSLGQMKALSILASTAAAALETASLYSQVRRAEENYRSIFDNAVEGIFQVSRQGEFLSANPALARTLGYDSGASLITESSTNPLNWTSRDAWQEFARKLESEGSLLGFEMVCRRRDGQEVILSTSARLVTDELGEILYFEGFAEDVTESRHAQAALRQSEAELRALFEAMTDLIVVFDHEGRYRKIAPTKGALTYWKPEDLIGKTVVDIFPPSDAQFFLSYIRQALAESRTLRTEYKLETSWKNAWYEFSVSPMDEASVVCVARDVTERKRVEGALAASEERLRQSQKLEAIGRLAGGVAHDFNNILTVIGGYSSLLLDKLPVTSPYRSSVEEIKRAGDRAGGLTRQLLAFSRKQILQPKVLDLNQVVSEMERLVRRLIGEDVELTAVLEADLGLVKADPSQVEQVLLNLLVNARDAMPDGGKLTIETKNVELASGYAQRFGIAPGSYVMLAVSDNGFGMDAETQGRIFEPFFTTKNASKGTGLGLSTVYGIVKQSGGHIWVYSEERKGTTFKIYLPRVQEHAEAETTEAPEAVPAGTETLLVVEDEDQVRAILEQMLKELGYKVIAAASGPEALDLARKQAGLIDLMITDLVMPQMSGRELVDRMRQQEPNIKVLFMSGYTDDAIVRHGLLDASLEFLQKPFDAAGVASKVRQVLDGGARAPANLTHATNTRKPENRLR